MATQTPLRLERFLKVIRRAADPSCREQVLWLAVIQQAACDVFSRQEAMRQQAQGWFFAPRHAKDFATVCELAGLLPEYVQSILQTCLTEPLAGRAA